MLAPHGTEPAEYLAEGLGTDALHQAGIAAGEVLVDVGGAEQGGGFTLTGQAVVAEEEFLYGAVAAVVAVAAFDVFHLFGSDRSTCIALDTTSAITALKVTQKLFFEYVE